MGKNTPLLVRLSASILQNIVKYMVRVPGMKWCFGCHFWKQRF